MALTISDNYVHSVLDNNENAARSTDDLERGLYVLQKWQKDGASGSPYKVLREYMVREPAINWISAHIVPKLGVEVPVTDEKTEKRKEKYARLERLALDNLYAEYTTQQLVDISGLGAQTITQWAKTTGFFRSAGRGSWEARNPKDDRQMES
jgi:hypothetical protein